MLPFLSKVAFKYRMDNIQDKFSSIRKGLLEFLLLKLISSDKLYVAAILKKLDTIGFGTQEGTLYPLLSRMRREELLDYEWQESDVGPPRKYYSLTNKGREQLKALDAHWNELNSTITSLGKTS